MSIVLAQEETAGPGGAGAVKPASPTDIGGLKLWLDGSDLNGNGNNPGNGSLVSQWTDKSGLGHHAINPDSATQPIYVTNAVNSRGGVNFGLKNNDFLETAATADLNFNSASIIIVANHRSSAAHMDIATPGASNNEFLIYDQGIYHHSSGHNYRAVGFSVPPSGFYIQLGLFGTSASDLENMINGMVSTTGITMRCWCQVAELPFLKSPTKLIWWCSSYFCNSY